jgi:hypothetical protein
MAKDKLKRRGRAEVLRSVVIIRKVRGVEVERRIGVEPDPIVEAKFAESRDGDQRTEIKKQF